jgi:hypothetical protein
VAMHQLGTWSPTRGYHPNYDMHQLGAWSPTRGYDHNYQ